MAEEEGFRPDDVAAERADAFARLVVTLSALPPSHKPLYDAGLELLHALTESIRPREKPADVRPIRGGKL